ncbi:hypothetical protein U0C82_18900 [Fulvimarina sp. 2208YS6-2-32]|uniref:Addiction module component n=2 Tax=Fulvimarina uroteuthidis TaxID=3098149 RepID=A0ABU5I751_9HYPH|nr:hypothetical protein [Fulvimarina sp. 2208YS6-2-32]
MRFAMIVEIELARIRSELLPELWDAETEAMFLKSIKSALNGMQVTEGPLTAAQYSELDARITEEAFKLY